MPRAAPSVERLPSQRADAVVREVEANNAELQRQVAQLQGDLKKALARRTCSDTKRKEAEAAQRETEEKKKKRKPLHEYAASTRCVASLEANKLLLSRFHVEDLPELFGSILQWHQHEGKLAEVMLESQGFRRVLQTIRDARDKEIAEHLNSVVYTPKVQAMLRILAGISLRKAGLLHSSFKWVNAVDGTRIRAMMAPDSKQAAPALFNPRVMAAEQKAAVGRSGFTIGETASEERNSVGAIVTGAFALDLAISQVLKQAAGGRAGGMATAGTKSDPHLVVVTVDGARGSQAQSVARLAFFLGSTEYLSQAAGDCTNLAIWRSQCATESYETMAVHLLEVRPGLCRLFEDSELPPNGEPSGVHVAMVQVSDLPAIRKVNGLLSHLATSFGAPFCECTRADMYKFDFDPLTHVGDGLDYIRESNAHHVADWEALLDKPEPKFW